MDIQRDHVLHSESGRFGSATTTQQADVQRILLRAASANPRNGLAIHFHGGLVNQAAGRSIADRLVPRYLGSDLYPLFFIWESGLIESITNNLREVPRDKAFQELVKKVSEWVLKKVGARAGLKGGEGNAVDEPKLRREFDEWFDRTRSEPPVSTQDDLTHADRSPTLRGASALDEDELAQEIEAGLDGDPGFQDTFQQLHNATGGGGAHSVTRGAGSRSEPAGEVLVDERALRELFPGQTASTKGALTWFVVAKFVAKIVIAVARRYSRGRAHGMYCTVVEEVLRAAYLDRLGTVVWNQMKADTVQSFEADPDCCGTALLRRLDTMRASGKTFSRLSLVGHSTGAIYICNFLDAAAKVLPDTLFDLIFLAPAVTHERFASTLSAHASRIRGFRMFAMTDALETDDTLVPILYTRSLLYFVSGVLEGREANGTWQGEIDAPLVGMQRYANANHVFTPADFPHVNAVTRFLTADARRTVWSRSDAGAGMSSAAHKHGDFDNDETTLSSVISILQNGF